MLISTLAATGIVTIPRDSDTFCSLILLFVYNDYKCVPSVEKFISKYCPYIKLLLIEQDYIKKKKTVMQG